jgi:hypothetical protein
MTTSTLTPDAPDSPDTTATAVIDPAATAQYPTAQYPTPQLPASPAAPAAEQPYAAAQYAASQNAAAPLPQQHTYPSARPTNVLGVITLVLGVLGFAIVPVITGHIALAQIKRTGEEGRGITMAGLILGYIGLAGYVIAALFFFGVLFLGAVGAIGSYR